MRDSGNVCVMMKDAIRQEKNNSEWSQMKKVSRGRVLFNLVARGKEG